MVHRISSPVFVGREAELAAFDRLVARVAQGTGCVLTIAGEAGIGKSRLVAELDARLRKASALVLAGECMEVVGGELAFAPIVAALRPVMSDGEVVHQLEAPLRTALGALWPTLGEASGTSREQLFEAIYRVLAGLAEDRLVVLIIEDLHWIDRSSRDLLGFLVRNARRDRLLLVATYRLDDLHRGHPLRPFLSELERSGQAQRLELQPLGRAELAEQLGAIAGAPPAREVIDGIFTRCEGNPFFAEELLATDADGGDELPDSLRDALLFRFHQLAPTTQDVLRAAAVVGRSVDHRLLGRVCGVAEGDMQSALREATEHHVLVLTGGGGLAYAFRHGLLREAIYDDTLPGERLRLHRLIAETLAADPELATSGAAAELAHHWHAAGELPAALTSSLQAAADAQRMTAYKEAVAQLQRALVVWDRVQGAEEIAACGHVELLLRAAEMAEMAGDPELALTLGERARKAVDSQGTPLLAAAAETRIGRALWQTGRGDDAIAHLADARRLVPADPPSIQLAEALAEEGRTLMLTGRMSEARGRLEQALELAAELSAPHVEASALNSLAMVYSMHGEHERAIASGRRALEIATEVSSAVEILRAYVNGSQAIDNAGRMQEALELGIEGIEAARLLGLERAGGDQLRAQAAWRLSRLGRYAQAEDIIAPVMEAASAPFAVASLKSLAGQLAVERGDFALAERLLSEAWPLLERSGGSQLIGPAQAAWVSLYLLRGELEAAEQRVAGALDRIAPDEPELIDNAALYWLAARTQAELATVGDGADDPDRQAHAAARAEVVVADMDKAIAAIPGAGAPPEALAFRALAFAELARARGEPDQAAWHAAGKRFGELGEAYREAYAHFREAEAMTLAGAPAQEVEGLLREAHATAAACGTVPLKQQVESLARQLGITIAGQAHPGEREMERAQPPVDDVVELLTGTRRGPRPDRLLATILFTDIVGSTDLAASLGDKDWRQLLDRHDELVRAHLPRFGGVAIKFIGDGTLTTFDGPGRAIEFACTLRDAVNALGIEIRAGVHTGEIELRGDDIGGIAVHIAARVVGLAAPSEILVSQTVTDVVAGSGIEFEERGSHTLKGLSGSWRLSAVADAGARG
jgi:class 3 adenylate cyclase/tetratricopeptide (TPR) repeat protein